MGEELHVVTGAFSYTGKYIARRLLATNKKVRTLVRRPDAPNPFGDAVEVRPLDFSDTSGLAGSLQGAAVLYNTYWIRFARGGVTFDSAVENTRHLIRAAREAGVRRFVHLSVTNPAEDSPLGYFRGKAQQERALRESGLSYAIIRPTLTFGPEDILVNNIAWLLRKLPFFPVPGAGAYRVQPVFVEDVVSLAVKAGAGSDNLVIDAAGPEVYSFQELLWAIARATGRRLRALHTPPRLAVLMASLVGRAVGDVVITTEEIAALMSNLLVSHAPPTGRTSFRQWLADNAPAVGSRYTSEIKRHWR